MPVFKMQGMPVTNFGLYLERFDPCSALRQRELMASFVRGHMQLDDAMRFHVSMVCTAVDGMLLPSAKGWKADAETVQAFPDAGTYWDDPLQAAPRNVDAAEEMRASCGTLVRDMAAWCENNIDETALCNRLCLLLTAMYALAQTDLVAYPPDKEQILSAWKRRKSAQEDAPAGERKACILPVDSEELIPTVVLPPDPAPYVCKVFDGRFDALAHRIRTYCIKADSRSAYGVQAQVLLDVGGRTVCIRRGDHVYVNAVNGGIVRVLPACVSAADSTLQREDGDDDALSLSFGGALRMIRFTPGQKVTSFAVGDTPDSLLIIRDNRLCIDYFAQRASFVKLQILQERKVVEVRIIDGDYVVLQDNGRVHSSSARFGGLKQVTTLEDIETTWQNYREEA